MSDRLEVYADGTGRWRWRVTAGNGRVVDASSQSFASKGSAVRNYRRGGGTLTATRVLARDA